MTSHGGNGVTGADIRAKLDHPVVDADGHMMECSFAVLDFVKQVGGPEIAKRYEDILRNDQTGASRRAVWVGNSGPASIDRATALLPKLFRARLDDAGEVADHVDQLRIGGDDDLGVFAERGLDRLQSPQ